MKLDVLEEKKPAVSKAVWKKALVSWAKTYKLPANVRTQNLEEVEQATRRIQAWFLILQPAFSKESYQSINPQLDRVLTPLNSLLLEETSLQILQDLARTEKQGDLRKKILNILGELREAYDQKVKKVVKLISEFNGRKAAAQLVSDFDQSNISDQSTFAKELDVRRDKLFNQMVEVIRSTNRESLISLQIEVEKFCYMLELTVPLGFEKGKKLLQVLKTLNARLKAVQEKERFREFIQALEVTRSGNQAQVADVVWLRAIRLRLGLKQAETLREYHAHIPVSLQVLKRKLSWK